MIALTPGSIEGEPAAMALVPGQERWMDPTSRRIRNAGTTPLEFLRFDFKTAPLGR